VGTIRPRDTLYAVLKSLHCLKIEQCIHGVSPDLLHECIQYKFSCFYNLQLKFFKQYTAISTAFSVFNLTVPAYYTRSSDIITLQCTSVRSRPWLMNTFISHAHDWQVFTHACSRALKFSTQTTAASCKIGVSGSITRHCYWFLHLPSPRISFALNSKLFSLNNPFLLSLAQIVDSLAPWPSQRFSSHSHFHSVVHFHLGHLRQYAKPPLVLAACLAGSGTY